MNVRVEMEGQVLTVIEPIPEVVETMLYKVLSRSEIEPGIDCLSISPHPPSASIISW